jgi:transcription elongation factor Elf1
MNILPKDLEYIILVYLQHLKMKDVLDELKKSYYTCYSCFNDNFIQIHHKKCNRCEELICNLCENNLECPNKELCNDCFYEDIIPGFVEDIIRKPLRFDEYDILFELYFNLSCEDKHQLCIYLIYVNGIFQENMDFEINFNNLYEDILNEI